MFWKLVKYELQSVRKWYLGIYGIAILLSIPLGLMLQKFIFVTEQSHQEPSLLFFAFFTLMVFATIIVWGAIYIATIVLIVRRFAKTCLWKRRLSNQYAPSFCSPINLV